MTVSSKLTENEIRPDRLRAEHLRHIEADIEWLRARQDDFVMVACPACGANDARMAFTKHGFSYVRCETCETLFMNPRPAPQLLQAFYETSQNYSFWNAHVFPASEEARRTQIFRPRAQRLAAICRRHNVRTNVLLEIGAGFGTFGEEVRELDIFERVILVEPTPDLANTCRARGLEVIEKPVEQVELAAGSIDVIASFEVIEHLFAPRAFVEACWRLLAPGGVVLLTCPNIKGFDLTVLGALSATLDHEHLNYFHPQSLSRLLRDCGFEILEIQTPGKLDAELVRKKILSGEFDAHTQPFLQQLLIHEWEHVGDAFQTFLADHLLSSHLWITAQKQSVDTVQPNNDIYDLVAAEA